MSIKISDLKKPRREGNASFTHDAGGVVQTEEIPISFLKPTQKVYDDITALEDKFRSDEDETTLRELRVRQLKYVEILSPAITNDDATPHQITEDDLRSLDISQLEQLWSGVCEHFFLRTPQKSQETNTKSSSEKEEISDTVQPS